MTPRAYESREFPWEPFPFRIPLLEKITLRNGQSGRASPNGKPLVAVTKFLSLTSPIEDQEALAKWRNRVGHEEANRISNAAAGRGTALHTICEKWLNNEGIIQTGNISADYDFHALAPQLDKNIEVVKGTELWLYSERLGLNGYVDAVVRWKGKLAIVDFKTTTNHKRREWVSGYFMQCAIYALMVYEIYGEMPEMLVLPMFTQNDISTIYEAELKEFLPHLKQRIGVWEGIKDEFL